MKVEILGPPEPKLDRLVELATEVARELELEIDIITINDTGEVMRRGVTWTPALLVDGEVKVEGRLPSRVELLAYLDSRLDRKR